MRKLVAGNSLGVQWLGLGAFTVVGLGSVPDWGTEIPQNCKAWPKKEKRNLVECKIRLRSYGMKKKNTFLDFMYKFTAIIYYT